MSDGQAGDASHAAREFAVLNDQVTRATKSPLELHVIGEYKLSEFFNYMNLQCDVYGNDCDATCYSLRRSIWEWH